MLQSDGSWVGCHDTYDEDTVDKIVAATTKDDLQDIFDSLLSDRDLDGAKLNEDEFVAQCEMQEEFMNAVPQIRERFCKPAIRF